MSSSPPPKPRDSMAPTLVHLPNGHTLTVTPVFGGLFFKANELTNSHSPFPAGWTIVLHSEDYAGDPLDPLEDANDPADSSASETTRPRRRYIHRYKKPTLQNDHLYISSISNPSSSEFRPASSPTRQIAMMLWATLLWYFHQPEPDPRVTNKLSSRTADEGKPHGEWKIFINREGIFKGKVVLPKLERMGLVATEDSAVGVEQDERSGEGWQNMFVSRRSFWQLDARIYLFTLSPTANSPYPAGSPYVSRPSSPSGEGKREQGEQVTPPPNATSQGLWSPSSAGPFHSTSHLPTYYPPPPTQYTLTHHIRHPIRPKPPRQGEPFYTRFIPSVGQYLSFRVACISNKPPVHRGPTSSIATAVLRNSQHIQQAGLYDGAAAGMSLATPCDVDLLNKWMNEPRVDYFWGEAGPRERQQAFLDTALRSKHSFPVIGMWDGKPFGFFEIYWAKEDQLGRHLAGLVGDYDRGLHCLVGEEEFRGPRRVKVWLSALVHFCWLADNRTEVVLMEPRVDNDKLIQYCHDVGFFKEREISFPHKQASLMKIRRDAWTAPEL